MTRKTRSAKKTPALSGVEQKILEKTGNRLQYAPTEKIPTLLVEHFPELGKATALRFLEWIQQNPGGVISLPTGKTPEHFIRWVEHLLQNWNQKETRKFLEQEGIDPAIEPDMKSLHFVQIDEFYPISPLQVNSFFYYVNRFYLEGFGLDPEKALLMDCSKIGLDDKWTLDEVWPDQQVHLELRYRHARNVLEQKQRTVLKRVDEWCMDYEEKIRNLGGIGFFLGGIGPDGHIGFNISGSSHFSATRLCQVNYETQAAASTDLGGIEVAQKRLVITIGLNTITHNPQCVALIMAAGEAKAPIVAQAIESPRDIMVPATALHTLPNARFYITRGAAVRLQERRLEQVKMASPLTDEQVQKICIDLAVEKDKRLLDLTAKDSKGSPFAEVLKSQRPESLPDLARMTHESLVKKIDAGIAKIANTRFLHTEPHHDDVMLGYFAHVVRTFRDPGNRHHFLTLTSGFTSVTNAFMEQQLRNLRRVIDSPVFRALAEDNYFDPANIVARNRDVWQYLDGVAADSEEIKAEGCSRRLLRNLVEVFDEARLENLRDRTQELEHYFATQYPGKKDPDYIQRLKGMAREWEAECLWGYYGWQCENVQHLRLGFYKGNIFTEEPTRERDAMPILEVLRRVRPEVLTVAFDPEGSGPDTHYKVLQATAEAIRMYQEEDGPEPRVWGYRNVWYRFDPSEANIFVPVSLCMFSVMHQAFMNSFLSQKDASFPSYEHSGPFSELARKIQVEQYQKIKVCLGREWFHDHPSALIRASRGLVFLKEMDLGSFLESARALRESMEKS